MLILLGLDKKGPNPKVSELLNLFIFFNFENESHIYYKLIIDLLFNCSLLMNNELGSEK